MNVESIIVTSAAGAALLGVLAHWTWSGVKWLQAVGKAAAASAGGAEQLKPNGGSTMLDKVNATNQKVDLLIEAVAELQTQQRRRSLRR